MFKFIILVLQLASLTQSANILAIIPSPIYSHQVAFFDLWNQLSLRGHKVTVITTNPQRNEKLTNLTEIDISWTYKLFTDISDVAETVLTPWNFHQWVYEKSSNISQAQLSHPQIQDLIHGSDKNFDVLLIEFVFPEFLGFAEKFGCPTILVGSMDVFATNHLKLGNPAHPCLNPDMASSFYPPLDFSERVISSIYYLYTTYLYEYVIYPGKDRIIHKFFNTTSSLSKLLNNVDMLFTNVNPVINSIRAVGPTTINVGSLRQITVQPLPLPQDLASFLDNATDGFVYFSLGSNVNSKDLKKESFDAIAETLGNLSYKVLWKFEADEETFTNKPTNIKLIKWAPQLSILAHPNIKLFVTQGGLQSMEEAIYNEVPCVVIPFFSDQEQNAKLMKSKGISHIVARHPFIKRDELKSAINEVISNPKYKHSVSKLKRLSTDFPMSGLEKAIWWTEYVIRNKGAKHLRNPAADLPTYQYYFLDVIAFLILVTVLILSVLYILMKTIYKVYVARISNKFSVPIKKMQ